MDIVLHIFSGDSYIAYCSNIKKVIRYRPSFTDAGDPKNAERLYKYLIAKAKEQVPVVETGIFGADMKVSLVNDGPFTIVLDDTAFE